MAAAERKPSPDIAALLADPAALRARILAEKARRSGSKSFYAFTQQGWLYVPRVEPFEPNWHVKVICDHLEEVAHGRIPKLIVNIPPGHAKSVIASVLFPAWVWSWWPRCQLLHFSYSDDFVRRDSDRCREVIMSDWYQQTYCEPGGWNLRADYGGVTNFQNTAGGERVATSTGGKGGGLRAHIIVGDDPLNISDAHSDSARNEANNFIGQTISQRWVDKRRPRFALVMQRLSEGDPSDFVASGGDAEVLRMPAEFDKADPAVTHHYVAANDNAKPERREFWRDPRSLPPEQRPTDVDPVLLFPQRFPRDVIEASKKPNELGIDGFEAQGNQRPVSFAGGMFARIDWRFYRRSVASGVAPNFAELRPRGSTTEVAAHLPPMFERTVITMDAAFKANPDGSRVAIHCWGRAGANRYLRRRDTRLMDFVASCAALQEMARAFPDAAIFVEDAANGPAIMSQLKAVVPKMVPFTPSKYGSKTARAAAGQPYQRAHNCHLPEGDPGMDEFVGVMAGFPKGKISDDTDAFSMAMIVMEDEPENETGNVPWNRR